MPEPKPTVDAFDVLQRADPDLALRAAAGVVEQIAYIDEHDPEWWRQPAYQHATFQAVAALWGRAVEHRRKRASGSAEVGDR